MDIEMQRYGLWVKSQKSEFLAAVLAKSEYDGETFPEKISRINTPSVPCKYPYRWSVRY